MAFVLHDVFRYPFAEIADVLGRTPAACKQLAASAGRRVSPTGPPVTAAGRADVVREPPSIAPMAVPPPVPCALP